MAISIKCTQVALNTGTGTQDITISGFGTPKAAMFFVGRGVTVNTAATHACMCVGLTDGTRQNVFAMQAEDAQSMSDTDTLVSTAECVALVDIDGTYDVQAAFSAWITDGVRINITNAGAALLLTVVLIGGTDVSAYVDQVTTSTQDTEVDITAPGFEPDLVFVTGWEPGTSQTDFEYAFGAVHNDTVDVSRSYFIHDDHNDATNEINGEFSETYALSHRGKDLEISGFDASGFSAYARNGSGASNEFNYLALKLVGASVKVATHTTPTTTGNQSESGFGWQPDFLMLGMSMNNLVDTMTNTNDGGSCGVGVADGTNEYSITHQSEQGVGTTNTQSITDTKLINHPLADGTTGNVGTLVSFDSGGFTVNYSAADSGKTHKYWYCAINVGGGAAATSLIPPSRARAFANLLNH